MAKWEGGRGTISYSDLPKEMRESLDPSFGARKRSEEVPPQPAAPDFELAFERGAKTTISGQVFVTTRGAQNIKLGGVTVALYSEKNMRNFSQWLVTEGRRRKDYYIDHNQPELVAYADYERWSWLPRSPYRAMTDADGRYVLTHDVTGEFYVVATGTRLLSDKTEYYVWVVPSATIPPSGELFLNNANLRED